MSRRPHFNSSDPFKYLDHEIVLNAVGQFYCPDYNITGASLDIVKAEIKAREEKKNKLPKIKVWFQAHGEDWKQGQTTGAGVGYRNQYVWVTFPREKGSYLRSATERQQVGREYVFPVSEKNDAIIAQLQSLSAQLKKVSDQYDDVKNTLEGLPDNKEE